MKTWRDCRTWGAPLIATLLLSACDSRQQPIDQSSTQRGLSSVDSTAMAANQAVTIKLGQLGEEFIRANGHIAIEAKREPSGLNFYLADWPVRKPGSVKVEMGIHSFQIDRAVSVLGTEDTERLNDGVHSFDVGAVLADIESIPHLEARNRIMALLSKLQAVGWQRSMSRSDPRFSGPESVKQSIAEFGTYALDPAYTPTPDEWMALGEHVSWGLWASGTYLTLDLHRDTARMDPNKPGAYFLSFELHTEEQELRLYFAPDDRNRWRELWPERQKQLPPQRAEAETKARAEGRTIDERYQDPPLMQPKTESTLNAKPEPKKQAKLLALPGDPCPQSGYWSAVALPGQRVLVIHGDPMPGPKYGKTGAVIWSFEGPARRA